LFGISQLIAPQIAQILCKQSGRAERAQIFQYEYFLLDLNLSLNLNLSLSLNLSFSL
jgi:hypothetical protein